MSFLSSSPPQNDFIPAVASPTRGVWYLPHLYHTDRIGSDEQIVSTVASSTFLFLHLHCHSGWLARGNAPTMNLLPVTQTRLHSHLCSPLVSRVQPHSGEDPYDMDENPEEALLYLLARVERTLLKARDPGL